MRTAPLLVLALVAPAGCHRGAAPATGANPAGGPTVVKVTRPAQKPVRWAIEQPASVQPLESTPVVAKLPGYLKSIAPDIAAVKAGIQLPGGQAPVIDIGSVVEADQLLATVSIPELTAEVAEKAAMIERARAEQRQAEEDRAVADKLIKAAEEMVKEAEAGIARADADVTRWKAELDQVNTQITGGTADVQTRNVVTKNWDAAKAARAEAVAKVATAGAGVEERKARRSKAQADVDAAAARVRVAEAERDRVKALEGYTQVRAPFPGIVTARHVHPGHFLQPAAGMHGTVLFTVVRADVVRVFADIPEVNAPKAGVGTPATVRVPSLGGREYPATVTRTTGIVDPGTRTLRVEIDVVNKDGALKPGLYATVRIDAEATDATVLPAGCVLPADETHYVFVVDGGKAVKYRVQLGRTDPGTVQVLGRRKATATAGGWEPFTGTEAVVTGNLGALVDGAEVKVE
ncbi:efflux RND transporter periplasmic adaptor subunit [Frigoriglobus tundricola]|uniref:Putative Co/Zn/Cd efflux system membrane fusion protein n=1 Tax=Frigoriglobus tundricola TaxID=2774151 RepID=A0A6M5YYU8_9BACT|nr:efflux RND transporter periplasmic adaptor subunit [Frigoriglobus tundricola]QJW99307.1 putative Co/Zn/Cd efflux system membrane fusion protein [Frigoriglobus tundricola]